VCGHSLFQSTITEFCLEELRIVTVPSPTFKAQCKITWRAVNLLGNAPGSRGLRINFLWIRAISSQALPYPQTSKVCRVANITGSLQGNICLLLQPTTMQTNFICSGHVTVIILLFIYKDETW